MLKIEFSETKMLVYNFDREEISSNSRYYFNKYKNKLLLKKYSQCDIKLKYLNISHFMKIQ